MTVRQVFSLILSHEDLEYRYRYSTLLNTDLVWIPIHAPLLHVDPGLQQYYHPREEKKFTTQRQYLLATGTPKLYTGTGNQYCGGGLIKWSWIRPPLQQRI